MNETALCAPRHDQHYLPRTRDSTVLVLVYFEGCRRMAVIGKTGLWKMRPKKGKLALKKRKENAGSPRNQGSNTFIPVSK